MEGVSETPALWDRLLALANAVDRGVAYRWGGVTIDLSTAGKLDPEKWTIHLTAMPHEGGLALTLGSPDFSSAPVKVFVPSSPPQRLHLDDIRIDTADMSATAVQVARARLVQSERGIRPKPLGEVLFSRRSGVREPVSALDVNGLWPAMRAVGRLEQRLKSYEEDPRKAEVQGGVARAQRLAAEIMDGFVENGLPERETGIGLLMVMYGAGIDTGVIDGVIGDELAKAAVVAKNGRQSAGASRGGNISAAARSQKSAARAAHARDRAGGVLFAHGAPLSRDALCHDVVEAWAFRDETSRDISASGVRGYLKGLEDDELARGYLAGVKDETIRKQRGAGLSDDEVAEVRFSPLKHPSG